MICKCGAKVEPAYEFTGRCENCYALDMNRIASAPYVGSPPLSRRYDRIREMRKKQKH